MNVSSDKRGFILGMLAMILLLISIIILVVIRIVSYRAVI